MISSDLSIGSGEIHGKHPYKDMNHSYVIMTSIMGYKFLL